MVQALRRATKGEWRFPAKLSIDVGRESAANMNENRQGAKSLQEIAAEEGTDAFSRLEQIAIEAGFIKELSTKYGVPETAIRMVTQQLPANASMAASLGTNVTQDAVDATIAATAKPDAAAPAEPVTQIQNDSKLVTIDFETNTYIPTVAIADNAKRALEVRDKKPASQRGMTSVGIARARDLMNRRPQSEDTVRRMKAFFDRHEADKQGETWDEQGKGWQAWNGWGGDEGYSWATAIVERLNKQADSKELKAASSEVRQSFAVLQPPEPEEWLDAVQNYRKKQNGRVDEIKLSIIGEKSIVELSKVSKKEFIIPTPDVGEKSDAFMGRCMSNPTMLAEYPDEAQRAAVCNAQIGLEKKAMAEGDQCPVETQDIAANLANRQKAVNVAHYGPANPQLPNADYWTAKAAQFKTTVSEAKTMRCGNCAAFNVSPRIKDCINKGIGADASEVEQAGELGYCEFFDFKCAGKRTCDAWVVGGPIKSESK
jgi:hypothetical protein